MKSLSRIMLSILLFCPLFIQAQKVTLVMSGGGAKGLAHIGVIKALEEEDIPINFVVGTSMGGVIAGCYAAGYSAEEIEAIMTSEAFIRWVNGELEPEYNYYYNQDDQHPFVLEVDFSLDSTFRASLQSSLASDLSLNFALAEKFAQPSMIAGYDFDSLFVPARILASDVFTQSEVILKEGSLASAVRTSLSVPFFYKPIRIERKYLFDGGIYNNFPVDVAQREFGGEVIIGVNVSSKVFKEYPYETDDELINKSLLFMLLDKSDPSSMPLNSIYIEPDLTGYTSFDFKKVKSLIDSGYVSTRRKIQEIKSKITSRETIAERKEKREEFWSESTPLSFSGVDLYGFNRRQRKYIGKLFEADKDEMLSFESIKKGYFKMVSEPYFQSIYPDIRYNQEDKAYRLELNDRPRSNLNVQLGGVIASRNISQVYLGLKHYYFDSYLLRTSLHFYAGNFYKSGQLKTRLLLSNLYPFYIEPEFTYNAWDFLDDDDLFIQDRQATILDRIDRKYALNTGFPVSAKFHGEIQVGHFNNEDRFAATSEFTSGDTLDFIQVKGLRAGISFKRNDLNRKQYPNDGLAMNFSFDYFSANENYIPGSNSEILPTEANHRFVRLKGRIEQYFRKNKYSTGYLFEAVFSNQPVFATNRASVLYAPAFEPIMDSRTLLLQNLVSYNYIAAGWRNVFTISDLLEFRLEGYVFQSLDGFRSDDEQLETSTRFNRSLKFAATGGLVLHSPLGPVSLSANYYDDEENQFGVLLHVGYLLFNKKSWE
ncbi:patatin-like phospholipase family protein [Fulvivirga sedimenti]|uniref:Patatin-like phospholipase family protein n=1 Tax=Fulvivirga sedimenti TaxID=2879465 RepID=A0A9X1L1V6_9BACT|nr:patatin-like phospholipase family protein [Fulvivirga sedimenti]MCA6078632.1 patatin-like phospholipase family protein [Fulvivirga sedimenti]